MEELIYSSAKSVAAAIRGKQVSCAEVLEAHLRRIEDVNPSLNAVVQLAAERAQREAAEADRALVNGELKGPLHGVPMTIKDSLDTEGVVSTGGTQGRAAYVPNEDATVVARMRAAGAILVGKTNTPELTLAGETNNLVYGRTNNPYDVSRTCGGSSGGAGAIIAAGGSPLDLGSDTGGSVRLPSHFCGIAGLKPTAGRVPRTGHVVPFGMGAMDPLTVNGPLARYVEDLEIVLPIISGVDWRDPYVVPMPLGDPAAVDVAGLSVAVYTDNGIVTATPETVQTVSNAAAVPKDIGATVTEDRPAVLDQSGALFVKLGSSDGRAWIRRLLDKAGTTNVHPWLLQRLEAARPLPVGEFTAALEEVDAFRSAMLGFLERYGRYSVSRRSLPRPGAQGPSRRGNDPAGQLHQLLQSHRLARRHRAGRDLSGGPAHRRPGSSQALAGGRGPSGGQETRRIPGRMAAPAVLTGADSRLALVTLPLP